MNTKYCPKCKEDKNTELFNKNKTTKCGFSSWCKKCISIHNAKTIDTRRIATSNYYQQNKEKIKNQTREYRKNNRQKINKWFCKYKKDRRQSDVKYKLHHNISALMRVNLRKKNIKKNNSFEKIVGYRIEDLKLHLEKLFDHKMNWENHGSYWHIDHIKPVSAFKFNSIEDQEFKECWSLNNLQPLEKIENIKKGNKYEPEQNLQQMQN